MSDRAGDALAVFAGVAIITVLSIITVGDVNAYGEQALIALIAIGTLIFHDHFVTKQPKRGPDDEEEDDDR